MTLIETLDRLDKAILDRSPINDQRAIINSIREALEAHDAQEIAHSHLRNEHSNLNQAHLKLNQAHLKLQMEKIKVDAELDKMKVAATNAPPPAHIQGGGATTHVPKRDGRYQV